MLPSVMRRSPQLTIGSLMLLAVLVAVLVGPAFAPYNPETFHAAARLKGPGWSYLLGTDQFGRDILSRVLWGGRDTVLFGVAATALGTLLGLAIGVLAGYAGGRTDQMLMRLMDALMAMPTLLKALLIVTVLGPSNINAMLAVAIAFTPGFARIVRSTTLSVRQRDYVSAAIARGEGHGYIMVGEILPNVVAPVIVEGSIRVAFAIMVSATLSFLGLGAQPPSSEWGLMVAEARAFMFLNPWMVVWPSLAIAFTAVSFNLLGDGLRDALNPRVR